MKIQSVKTVFLLAVILSFNFFNTQANAAEWIVDNTPKTIDSKTYELKVALDFAQSGDTIFIKNGRYSLEPYSLKKDIEIKGESKSGVIIELAGSLYVRKQMLKLSQMSFVAGAGMSGGDMISVSDGGYEALDVDFDCSTNKRSRALSIHTVDGSGTETESEARSVKVISEPMSEERAALMAKAEKPQLQFIKAVKIKKMYAKNCFNGLNLARLGNIPVSVQEVKIENSDNWGLLVHASHHLKFEKVEVLKTSGITMSDSAGNMEQIKVSDCPTDSNTGIGLNNSKIDITSAEVKNCSGIKFGRSSRGVLKDIKLEASYGIGINVYGDGDVKGENIAITGFNEGIMVGQNSKASINRAEINKIKNIALSIDSSDVEFSDSSITDTKSGVSQRQSRVKMNNVRISGANSFGHSCGGDCGSLNANNVKIENFKDIAWFWYKASGMNYSGGGNSPDPIQYQKQRSPASSGF